MKIVLLLCLKSSIQHCEYWAKTSTLPGVSPTEVYIASHSRYERSTYSVTLPMYTGQRAACRHCDWSK